MGGEPPSHRPVFSKDRRELALAESKLQSHLMLRERDSLHPECGRFPHSTVGLVADRSAPPPQRARLVLATAPPAAARLVCPPRLHPALGPAVESGLVVGSNYSSGSAVISKQAAESFSTADRPASCKWSG